MCEWNLNANQLVSYNMSFNLYTCKTNIFSTLLNNQSNRFKKFAPLTYIIFEYKL